MRLLHADAYGNDFLLWRVERLPEAEAFRAEALRVCDRRRAGADGLIAFVETPAGARMQLRNADGSYSEVSGNGVRCLAAALAAARRTQTGQSLIIETDAGTKTLALLSIEGARMTFASAMGAPREIRRFVLDVDGEGIDIATLDVGNPQCVVVGLPGPFDEATLARIGPRLATHPWFPHGTNVELVRIVDPGRIEILIWERGVGRTSSSGTGTCASAVAAAAFLGARRTLDVVAPGGTQHVEWRDDGVWLTGWAEMIAEIDV